MELENFKRNIALNLGKEIFFNIDNTIKQGKIISISPNYIIELEENKKKIQYTFSNIFEYKLVNPSSNLNIHAIDYRNNKFVIYYHVSCNDGITSAWVINEYFKSKQNINFDNIEFIAIHASKENQGKSYNFNDTDSIILFLDVTPSV